MQRHGYHAGVFVSSTVVDLPEYRRAAIDAIWRCELFPLGMERSAAEPTDAVNYSLNLADQADVYVGIFAFKYSDPPAGYEMAITEMEYRRAVERGIPILIFLAADSTKLHVKNQSRANEARLARLKAELRARHVVSTFTSVDDFSYRLFQSLVELKQRGLIAGDQSSETMHAPTVAAIPHPPVPYIAHPYIPQSELVGRAQELAALDEWAASKDTVMVLESIGGSGKSAITWHWLMSRAPTVTPPFDGMIWWSFYESDATVSNLIKYTLAYLTESSLEEVEQIRMRDRLDTLIGVLKRRHALLVLDGLERILLAYHRGDAARLRDEEVERAPAQDAARLRSCVTRAERDFLEKVVASAPSKVLVTSRLVPEEFRNHSTGLLVQGVRSIHLGGLTSQDAIALTRQRGITGNLKELDYFLGQFDYHPLLIDVVSGRIRNYRPAPGNFDAWYKAEGSRMRLTTLDLAQRRTHILQYALDGLQPELRLLLSQIAAFRYPVDYAAVSVLNPFVPQMPSPQRPTPPDPSDFDTPRTLGRETREYKRAYAEFERANTRYERAEQAYRAAAVAGESRFHQALSELEDRGLLQWDRLANRYDLHPIVRAHAFEQLEGDVRNRTFDRIRDHFERLPPEQLEAVKDVSDLRRTIEIYYALTGRGLFDEAARFYSNRLANVLEHQLAAFETVEELLTPLFASGMDNLPSVSERFQQSNILDRMANSYTHRGNIEQALKLRLEELDFDLHNGAHDDLLVTLINFAEDLRSAGRLASAERVTQMALALAQANANRRGIAWANLRFLELYAATGDEERAEQAYQAAVAAPPGRGAPYWMADVETAYAHLLLHQQRDPSQHLDTAEHEAIEGRNALAQREILDMRAEMSLSRGQFEDAQSLWQGAIAAAEKSHAPTAYYTAKLAVVCQRQGDGDTARRYIREVLAALVSPEEAGRSYTAAAHALYALSDHTEAVALAERAYRICWADGPPYSWQWDLRTLRAMLQRSGAPIPFLPTWRPSNPEPTVLEEDIRAHIGQAQSARR